MKIESLVVEGIGGIRQLEISFKGGINVICGANGVGKTTILDIIADAFSSSATKLKRNALSQVGTYNIKLSIKENENIVIIEKNERIEKFQPHESEYINGWQDFSKFLFYFGINRNISYSRLDAIGADPIREPYITGQMSTQGIEADDIKNWFVKRYLFADKKDSLSYEQIENYKLAEQSFSILDNSVKFKTVVASKFDIMLETSKGDIYFEYLSSGYKSCIYIIFGIIKEIEYRMSDNPIKAESFDGVVLIDEVDLHLHPVWQAELVNTLKIIFPKAQFILTTHSPSILQTLDKDEIIALGYNEYGDTYLKELNLGPYGLQGWTLEEILKNVMEMPTTTSKLYQETIKRFDEAMNDEDRDTILEQYELLNKMLHLDNPIRKLLAIQVAEWEE